MTSRATCNEFQIDAVSSAAIREEIGDQLRITLARETNRSPVHMTMLVEQIASDQSVTRTDEVAK